MLFLLIVTASISTLSALYYIQTFLNFWPSNAWKEHDIQIKNLRKIKNLKRKKYIDFNKY